MKEGKAEFAKLDPPLKGYLGMERTVCKAEWAYEIAHVFDSIDNFKAYMGHPQREAIVQKYMAQIKPLVKDVDNMYLGNRVFDGHDEF